MYKGKTLAVCAPLFNFSMSGDALSLARLRHATARRGEATSETAKVNLGKTVCCSWASVGCGVFSATRAALCCLLSTASALPEGPLGTEAEGGSSCDSTHCMHFFLLLMTCKAGNCVMQRRLTLSRTTDRSHLVVAQAKGPGTSGCGGVGDPQTLYDSHNLV